MVIKYFVLLNIRKRYVTDIYFQNPQIIISFHKVSIYTTQMLIKKYLDKSLIKFKYIIVLGQFFTRFCISNVKIMFKLDLEIYSVPRDL